MTARFPILAAIHFSATLSGAAELDGLRAPANTACPTPEEAREKMKVPEGYEVRCFAHEPMVVNPIAMSWDARGRLWVLEAYEYPSNTPLPVEQRPFGGEAKDADYHAMPALAAQHPRDRVIILEDTDGDGVADKRTVFVEGLNSRAPSSAATTASMSDSSRTSCISATAITMTNRTTGAWC